jgi:hypothetical protein
MRLLGKMSGTRLLGKMSGTRALYVLCELG